MRHNHNNRTQTSALCAVKYSSNGVTVASMLHLFNKKGHITTYLAINMQCEYLNSDNTCNAKPYGTELPKPNQETLSTLCTNQAAECVRATIYRAYLKAGGK